MSVYLDELGGLFKPPKASGPLRTGVVTALSHASCEVSFGGESSATCPVLKHVQPEVGDHVAVLSSDGSCVVIGAYRQGDNA